MRWARRLSKACDVDCDFYALQVVLIHGLSTPSLIWKDVAHTLADSGYRVLLYDLYGRGYTEAPKTEYNAALYSTQLALLMQVVGWSKAIICGVSMVS